MRLSIKTLAAKMVMGLNVLSTKICIACLKCLVVGVQFDLKMAYGNFSLFSKTSEPKYDGMKISVTIAPKYIIANRNE